MQPKFTRVEGVGIVMQSLGPAVLAIPMHLRALVTVPTENAIWLPLYYAPVPQLHNDDVTSPSSIIFESASLSLFRNDQETA